MLRLRPCAQRRAAVWTILNLARFFVSRAMRSLLTGCEDGEIVARHVRIVRSSWGNNDRKNLPPATAVFSLCAHNDARYTPAPGGPGIVRPGARPAGCPMPRDARPARDARPDSRLRRPARYTVYTLQRTHASHMLVSSRLTLKATAAILQPYMYRICGNTDALLLTSFTRSF